MKIYTLSSCDTCRKALKLLRAAGHDLQVVDVRADGIAPADLAALAAAFGPRLVNRASATWRGLDAASRAKPPAELIAAHPTVMKRPAMFYQGAWHLGWDAATRARVLGE